MSFNCLTFAAPFTPIMTIPTLVCELLLISDSFFSLCEHPVRGLVLSMILVWSYPGLVRCNPGMVLTLDETEGNEINKLNRIFHAWLFTETVALCLPAILFAFIVYNTIYLDKYFIISSVFLLNRISKQFLTPLSWNSNIF